MGKCYECGRETDCIVLSKKYGDKDRYWCKECREKSDCFFDWGSYQTIKKAQMRVSKVRG